MSPPTDKRREIDLRTYARVVWSFKWFVLSCTVLFSGAAAFWSMRQPRVFEAAAIVEFDPSPSRPLGRDVQDVADPVGSFWSAREFLATQHRMLASRTVAERVVRSLRLHESPAFWHEDPHGFVPRTVAETALRLLTQFSVDPIKDTRLAALKIRSHDPQLASAIANAFVDTYVEKTIEDRMSSTVTALEWLSTQLESLRTEVESSELSLHRFKQDHNILSVSMEDRQNLVAGEITSFSTALTEARQKRIEIAARVTRQRDALSDDILTASAAVFDPRSSLQGMRERLQEKLAERDRLSVRYGGSHPEMVALNQEIGSLQSQLEREVHSIVANADADLREIRAVESGLRSALDMAHQAGLELNLREIEYRRLNRERENRTKLYDMVLQRTTETDLTRMLQLSHVRVVDRALEPEFPVSPNRTANTLIGLLAGLLFGIGGAFTVRMLDRRLRGPEAVEEMGLTVLGVIPHISESRSTPEITRSQRATRRRRSQNDLIVHDFPMSTTAECVRTVRTNLTFMAVGERRAQVFVITSSQPQEGKTTVASNLAASIAQSGKSVLLVDTDLRRPRIHTAFDIGREVGVSSYIAREASFDDIITHSRVQGLDVITSGPVPPNPAELLHSPGFSALIAAARAKYDTIIFDSPPLGAVTDAAIIAPQVDGVIVVVKSSRTTRDALASSLRQLRDVNAKILGAVVNDLDFSSDGYYGKGYYYRRYGEYYSSSDEGTTPSASTPAAAE